MLRFFDHMMPDLIHCRHHCLQVHRVCNCTGSVQRWGIMCNSAKLMDFDTVYESKVMETGTALETGVSGLCG